MIHGQWTWVLEKSDGTNAAWPGTANSVQAFVIPLGRAHALYSHHKKLAICSCLPFLTPACSITADARSLKCVYIMFKKAEYNRKWFGCFCLYPSFCNQVSHFVPEVLAMITKPEQRHLLHIYIFFFHRSWRTDHHPTHLCSLYTQLRLWTNFSAPCFLIYKIGITILPAPVFTSWLAEPSKQGPDAASLSIAAPCFYCILSKTLSETYSEHKKKILGIVWGRGHLFTVKLGVREKRGIIF